MRSNAPSCVKFCFPSMEGQISCMHSKLQLLAHPTYLRVVVPSANLVPYDWGEAGGVMENASPPRESMIFEYLTGNRPSFWLISQDSPIINGHQWRSSRRSVESFWGFWEPWTWLKGLWTVYWDLISRARLISLLCTLCGKQASLVTIKFADVDIVEARTQEILGRTPAIVVWEQQ